MDKNRFGRKLLLRHPFLFSFALALAFLLFCGLFGSPFLLVNDDWWSVFVTQGSAFSLHPDEHLFFSNVLLGLLLKGLNLAFPGGPWYPLLLLSALFLALGCFASAFVIRGQDPWKLLFFFGVLLQIGVYFFLNLNYSLVSGLCFQAGLFLYFQLFTGTPGPHDKRTAWLGGACFWLALLLRWKAVVAWTLFLFPLIALGLYRGRNRPGLRGLMAGLLLLLSLSALGDYLYFQKDAAWRNFQDFTYRTAPAIDWGVVEHSAASEAAFKAAGFDPIDLLMFKNWYYMDENLFRPGNFARIKPYIHHEKPDLPAEFGKIGQDPLFQGALFCFLAFFLLCPLSSVLEVLVQALWIPFMYLLFFLFLRLPDRLLHPSYFFLAVLPLFFSLNPFRPLPKKEKPLSPLALRIGKYALFLLAFLGLPALASFHSDNQFARRQSDGVYGDLARLSPRNDQLFVAWDSSFPFEGLDPFRGFQPLPQRFNLFSLATFQTSPLSRELLDRFKIHHLLEDMTDRPDVFLICSPLEGALYHRYMLEKHGMRIYPEIAFDGAFFTAYRIHSKPLDRRQRVLEKFWSEGKFPQ